MPVYNGERHIRDAITSILGQTFQNLELIISDNASTDGTEAICHEFAEGDPRVRYYRNLKNLGIPENYNIVFRHARGQYFKWASSNDYCDPRFVETCVDALDGRPDVVLAYPKTRLIRNASGEMEDYHDGLNLPQADACERLRAFYSHVYLNNVMNGLIRAEVLRRTPLIAAYLGSDVVLMAEVALYGRFVEVPEFLFFRRMDRRSATRLQSREEVMSQYEPAKRKRMLLQRWRGHQGCFFAVTRAPLSLREKACLYRFLWQRFIGDRGYLAQEVREAVRTWIGRQSSRGMRAGGR